MLVRAAEIRLYKQALRTACRPRREKEEDGNGHWHPMHCRGRGMWGWVLIVLGAYFIGEYYGIVPRGFPFWAAILLVIGVIAVTRNRE